MAYFGGKAGVFRTIINQIPPHRVYIEAFAGMAAVLRYKRAAERSYAVDLDAGVLARLGEEVLPPKTQLVRANVLVWLREYFAQHAIGGEFVYADPPYLHSTRRSRHRYRYELTEAQHGRLLEVLKSLPCPVAVSGYRSEMYLTALADWRLVTFQAATRGRTVAEECLWMNYPSPAELHDYRYLGTTFRERERIRRQQRRWAARLARMDATQRYALLSVLAESDFGPGPLA